MGGRSKQSCAGQVANLTAGRAGRQPALRRRITLAVLALVLASGCHAFRIAEPAVSDKSEKEPVAATPNKRSFRRGQFVFRTDFDLKQDLPLFYELEDLHEQIGKELQLPKTSALVQVYLFEDREHYDHFMHEKYPDLPKRPAFFVAQPHVGGGAEDLLVYTFWGDRLRQDLRHELTHALLHSVLKDVPLWLDEGLAEYFEMPPEQHGNNPRHVAQLLHGPDGPITPDLAHLEKLSLVQQMSPAEYREAWAWVHLMLHGKPEAKTVLVQYLQQLRTNPSPGSLQPRLAQVHPDLEEALGSHLAALDGAKVAAP
jgi:hypothetical protein